MDTASSAAFWNRCRFDPARPRGHYESYFQRANHPQRPLGFWIRYTLFRARRRAAEPVGEIWAVFFDGERERVVATKEVFRFSRCHFDAERLGVRVGDSQLDDGGLSGSCRLGDHAIRWDLRYRDAGPPLLLLPEAFYDRGFPKAKAVVGGPNARFSGALAVDGQTVQVDDWPGSQNHNWGSQHTDAYAWGQVVGFDEAPDAFFECSTARVKVGPLYTPWMTVLVLRLDGEQLHLNRLGCALRSRSHYAPFRWIIDATCDGTRVFGEISAPSSSFVALPYDNPPGGTKVCLNSKIGRCALTVHRPGHPPRHLHAAHRAAFELISDDGHPAVPLLDAPSALDVASAT